ncbi:hypothetical protein DL766_007427 [Monosporascus sp. MC13-8B]|uniref:MFS maltose permease n=1 Tax=Monosporascus cannonballus TaxID=155416 RepID=A0ABY0GXZ8_9PEZI|nr:hypothetical protein DL762_007904 [Monosporascus cannonballus]RYO98496.1 hypothetical protein DL763_002148 [Monosporascus cannonballus]RYP23888.1 hypothetical protein DL766_007427 [Monosporascus sp. MC13-8B]
MQQLRTLGRRLLVWRPLRSPGASRLFTGNTKLASHTRPQLPFLSSPLARNQQFRYLTTERKRWLAHEMLMAGKYTVYFWAILGLSVVAYWSVQQEWLERRYPTPHEWGFLTRMRFRLAKWAPERTDVPYTDWVQIGSYAKNVLERLEDPNIEGAGLQELTEDGARIEGIGKRGYDLSAKSEPWRRGYYEALMLCAKAAEHLDDQVVDTTRHLVFPADQVRGPSNPNPRPIAHGSPSAPHERDCERAFEPPETFYRRVLATRGFTPKQKMDAALEYASWLDFKGTPDASARMYERALSLANEGSLPNRPIYDEKTYVLRDDRGARKPSANLLTSLAALAAHKARNGDVSSALPILISVLRARRSLPSPQQSADDSRTGTARSSSSPWTTANLVGVARRIVFEPEYPPPPDDGEAPPARDPRELCEEAGLDLYIGEIIYASSGGSGKGREDGLAWTREAVDLAEEQLRKLGRGGGSSSSRDAGRAVAARKTCRECLDAGLRNWAEMAGRLAREERERRSAARSGGSSGWLGLWGDGGETRGGGGGGGAGTGAGAGAEAEETGRWAAEEQVVRERTRRAQELLDELEAPKTGLGAILWA